jgi:hypothetical protein
MVVGAQLSKELMVSGGKPPNAGIRDLLLGG